ncbi:MAG: 4-alpha-glucanotransferase [Bacteroidetes bacterium]|nr:4-alpha-glucanotransferase [Bacteroidota bacterium]
MKIQFYLRFHTQFGQSLSVSGNTEELGNDDPAMSLPMTYLNNEFWFVTLDIKKKELREPIRYNYILKNEEGQLVQEWSNDRTVTVPHKHTGELVLIDTWNHAGEYENVFFSSPFKQVLLKGEQTKQAVPKDKDYTHVFRVKAPLLRKHEIICLTGSAERLGQWSEEHTVLMGREEDWWCAKLDLSGENFPLAYKYGLYNTREKTFVQYENGNNRLLNSEAADKKVTLLHDGFVHLPNDTWKGSGVAIPVFSLRSKNSFGVGEFADIKLLVDWSVITGLKLIQLLPVNDTSSNFTWMDSYPYSAISAFALHPIYINLAKVAGKDQAALVNRYKTVQKELNALPAVDYEQVMNNKTEALQKLYEVMGADCLASEGFADFFANNKHWLEPYAAFSYLRDRYKTSAFETWATHSTYKKSDVSKLCSPKSPSYKQTGYYFFVQYQLHLQLKDAVDYAHKKGIVLKGDIPIGISRNSCDAWQAPEMYNMQWQAGAPPDDFAVAGQNWGFPTYNWAKMQEDGFSWWKQRFSQMSEYFDAFRIDHILGFFRIWSIPLHAVQGIMGRFVPCLPVHINEFGENGIWFDYQRYCRPFISDAVLTEIFGDDASAIKEQFLVENNFGGYDLQENFETQKQIEKHFEGLESDEQNDKRRLGLYDLVSNVLLFEEEGTQGQEFHFRISMERTSSFRYLDGGLQEKLKALCINYFFRRQDDFWFREAMQKLPKLKASTNMLVCGEDLGMVPHCVPEVMQQLGILSLEIQRMPKDPQKEFFHPNDAPYLSVITPSTHDMSTVRGWWEENRTRTRQFYNHVMGQWGEPPVYCESWINRAIIMQHLYSPAMWSIFQLQDLLGMSDTLRREKPQEERINDPANPKHYWQYRMHIPLEDLINESDFNEELRGYVENSGRDN